jgi:hypothetical protein
MAQVDQLDPPQDDHENHGSHDQNLALGPGGLQKLAVGIKVLERFLGMGGSALGHLPAEPDDGLDPVKLRLRRQFLEGTSGTG